jgi:hypothetical protein
MKSLKLKLAAGTAALVVVLGGGAAIAATQATPKQESAAIVADAAEELGVTSAELTAALKTALKNRVDAALTAGDITQAQATEMKQRIDAGEVPLVGFPGRGGHHGGPGHHGFVSFDAAATFLGITEAQLKERVRNGEKLAEIAQAEGKTEAGLVNALVAAAKERLDEEVAEGDITAAQRTQILADLQTRIEEAVDGEIPFDRGHGPRPDGGADA